MVGLLIAVIGVGAAAVSGIKGYMENIDARYRGEQRCKNSENPWNIYYDRKGYCRDLRTDEIRFVDHDPYTGDTIMKGQSLQTVANLSKEWREKRYLEVRSHHPEWQTTVYYGTLTRKAEGNGKCVTGDRWKDLDNGRIYVARSYNNLSFYMDIYSGKFVRISDAQVLCDRKHEKKCAKEGRNPVNSKGYATEERIREAMEDRENELEEFFREGRDDTRVFYSVEFALNNNESTEDRILANEEKKLMGALAPRTYA